MLDLLLDTLRSLRAHALRYFLTSLGIVWGAFMLTYLSASMEGTNRHFVRALESAGPRIVYGGSGVVLKHRVGERGARAVEMEWEDVERIRALVDVEHASPSIELRNQILRVGRRTKLLTVQGVSEEAQFIRSFDVESGRFLSPLDMERGARVAFLGARAAERLYGHAQATGRRLQIGGQGFRVVGVAARKGEQLINPDRPDDLAVLIPYTTARRWFTRSDVIEHFVFAPETREQSYPAVRRTREITGLHHDFDPEVETAMWFFNVQEILGIVRLLLLALRIFLVTAGLTTLVVGAIGVMNIMLVVVGERTHEIGLRKAVGASNRAIFLQFLAEAAAVCATSGAIGSALGIGAAQLVARLLPPESPLASAPAIDPFTLATIVGALVLVGMVAGLVPALRAASVPPAEALRA